MNILITGASRGLGYSIAREFAGHGYNLYLSSRNEKALQQAVTDLRKTYPSVSIESSAKDLSIKQEAQSLASWIKEKAFTLDILVNNAGSFVPGSVYNEPEGSLELMMNTNLYSAYHLTRAILPLMMQRKSGHIFNICSIAALKAYANGGAYSISKFAMLGFSKNLREEMMPHGVKVTAVLPGAAYTDSWKASGIDEKRIMEASDIAKMVYASSCLSPQACVEDIVLRPQLGDL